MGILQSHLSTVPQSQYGREDTDPRGVLQSLWLQPKVCHHQAQWSFSRAENFGQTTPAFFQVHFSGPLDPASHLGGIRLPLVSAAKSAVAALAALGQKTLLQQIPPSLKNERSCALGWIPSNSLRSSTKSSIASLSWLTSATAHPPISKPMTSAPWKTKLYKQYRKTLPSRSTSENTMYPRVRFYMSRRFPLRVRFLNGLTGLATFPALVNMGRYRSVRREGTDSVSGTDSRQGVGRVSDLWPWTTTGSAFHVSA